MKKAFLKLSGLLANAALLLTIANVNATCIFHMHQPELPQGAAQFKRF